MPNHYAGDLRHTLAISGLSHVRTELPHLLVIPLLPPHPVESNREFPRHGYLSDPSLSSHGQVEKMASPVGITTDRRAVNGPTPGWVISRRATGRFSTSASRARVSSW